MKTAGINPPFFMDAWLVVGGGAMKGEYPIWTFVARRSYGRFLIAAAIQSIFGT